MSRIEMRIQPNDILLAFKAIALSEKLNGTEKQVGAFLVDSFNRRTGQCDPSVDTQAVLSTKSRRTMFRAIDRLVRLRFFRRIRHGGSITAIAINLTGSISAGWREHTRSGVDNTQIAM
jgi:hypothetical protein